MYIKDKRTGFENITNDLELRGECPLTQSTKSEEYQLPTQRYREYQNTAILNGLDNGLKEERITKKKFKLTDKILKLYSTPIEREIPLKRARSVERKVGNCPQILSCVEKQPWFENTTVKGSTLSSSALQYSSNFVNDSIVRSGIKHLDSCSLARKSSDNIPAMKDESCVSEPLMFKMKTLQQIRPCHSGFAKEFIFKPGEAFKVNGKVLSQRLGLTTPQATPYNYVTSPRTVQPRCMAPKHWWNYLNEKINKKLMPPNNVAAVAQPMMCPTNKICKLCQLNPEHQDFVKQNQLGKGVLHIDLKRLTQVQSKDWSSYGHYTRVHKLRYTKRYKSLAKDNSEHRVDVDEDYLKVDVDRLMKIYDQKQSNDVQELNKSAALLWRHRKKKDDIKCANSSCVKFDADGRYKYPSNEVVSDDTVKEDYSTLQRPGTTTLRSCLNFTSRKTCFKNV